MPGGSPALLNATVGADCIRPQPQHSFVSENEQLKDCGSIQSTPSMTAADLSIPECTGFADMCLSMRVAEKGLTCFAVLENM
jgi:hypothetical protein